MRYLPIAILAALALAVPAAANQKLSLKQARHIARALGQYDVKTGYAQRAKLAGCRRHARTRVTCVLHTWGSWILPYAQSDDPNAIRWVAKPLDWNIRLYRHANGQLDVRGPYYFLCHNRAGKVRPC